MKNILNDLINKRRDKMKEYNDTPSYSWKKKLYRIELQLLDGRIKRERLKRQYQ